MKTLNEQVQESSVGSRLSNITLMRRIRGPEEGFWGKEKDEDLVGRPTGNFIDENVAPQGWKSASKCSSKAVIKKLCCNLMPVPKSKVQRRLYACSAIALCLTLAGGLCGLIVRYVVNAVNKDNEISVVVLNAMAEIRAPEERCKTECERDHAMGMPWGSCPQNQNVNHVCESIDYPPLTLSRAKDEISVRNKFMKLETMRKQLVPAIYVPQFPHSHSSHIGSGHKIKGNKKSSGRVSSILRSGEEESIEDAR